MKMIALQMLLDALRPSYAVLADIELSEDKEDFYLQFPCWQESNKDRILLTAVEQEDISDDWSLLQIVTSVALVDIEHDTCAPQAVQKDASDGLYAELLRIQSQMRVAKIEFQRTKSGLYLMFRHTIAVHAKELVVTMQTESWAFAVSTLHLDVFENWDDICSTAGFTA